MHGISKIRYIQDINNINPVRIFKYKFKTKRYESSK